MSEYVMTPAAPTDEMVAAGRTAAKSHGALLGNGQSLVHVFCAMLAAHPKAPADGATTACPLTGRLAQHLAEHAESVMASWRRDPEIAVLASEAMQAASWIKFLEAKIQELQEATAARPKAPPVGEAVAWRCDWSDWRQYHDESDPLPKHWDDKPDSITPLYPPEAIAARLQDSSAVHASMLQGSVAKITMEQCAHAHGGDVLARWKDFKGSQDAIAAARADEREKCARICDELGQHWDDYKTTALLNGDVELSNAASGEPRAAEAIAAAIRARSAEKEKL